MHGSVVIAMFLIIVNVTSQLPQNGGNSAAMNVTTEPSVTTTPSSCVTGKSVAGTCVRRDRCDHGTAVIDFTLYQPRGFKPMCPSGEVCCPPEYLVQLDSKTWVPENGKFDFDDND